MQSPRISASSYSNTAPLIWSFLYGSRHGQVELILDNAPARSAELLAQNRVDAALVPVIAYQMFEDVKLIRDVCVGATKRVRSVCLITKGEGLSGVRSVSLDVSSKTSVALTKIIFREFLGFEPIWKNAEPNPNEMLADSDCALIIGDPALMISDERESKTQDQFRKFDLVELWREFTNFGFVFAMWMTRNNTCDIDFADARDEGLKHLDEIIANYETEITLEREDFKKYLTENISFSIDDSMQKGLELYFELAHKHKLIANNNSLRFI
jgi:chorismate dehydratase